MGVVPWQQRIPEFTGAEDASNHQSHVIRGLFDCEFNLVVLLFLLPSVMVFMIYLIKVYRITIKDERQVFYSNSPLIKL